MFFFHENVFMITLTTFEELRLVASWKKVISNFLVKLCGHC